MSVIDLKLEGGQFDGYVFYHAQDRERALSGGSMHLGFGDAKEEEEDKASIEVGQRVCVALHDAGLSTTWDGTAGRRIRVYGPGVTPPPTFTCACCKEFREEEPSESIRVGSDDSKLCGSCASLPRGVVTRLVARRKGEGCEG
jgi:hypothetical protein